MPFVGGVHQSSLLRLVVAACGRCHMSLGSQGDKDAGTTGHAHLRMINIKGGFQQDDFVSHIDQSLQGTIQGLRTTNRCGHMLRRIQVETGRVRTRRMVFAVLVVVPQVVCIFVHEGLRQGWMGLGGCILIGMTVCDGGLQGLHDKPGWIPIGKALSQINRLVLFGKWRKFMPDGWRIQTIQAMGQTNGRRRR